jgi:cation diffusion facilitator CzcD-associated flavoprotein CzcO
MSTARPIHSQNRSIDDCRPVRVIVVGAGPCGIVSAIRLLQRVPNVSVQIYDKNGDFGGTWHQHRYPGVAADIPILCYQLTFEPNRNWSSMYPPGEEIGEYWKRVAKKYRLYPHAKFDHRVSEARWDETRGKWKFTLIDLKMGLTIDDEGDLFFNCMGQFNNWKWPNIPKRETFHGEMVHSAQWNEAYDFHGKRVALIGSGSTAVQILPKLQPIVSQLGAYIRNQMWVSPRFGVDYILSRNPELLDRNFVLTEELRTRFETDDTFYAEYRRGLETSMNSIHGFTLVGHPIQDLFRDVLTKDMQEKLAGRPDILKSILPSFPAGCRRVTPGCGFLEALVEENVEFLDKEIKSFTRTGIEMVDGTIREYDAIVCATGYDCSFRPPFPVVGRDEINLRDRFKDFPSSYLTVAVDGFPNMWMVGGPNSEVGTSHSMIVFETVANYVVKCVQKVQFEHIKSIVPSSHAASDFYAFVKAYFTSGKTVYGEKCRSTYRNGEMQGPSTALWPGSVLHLMRTLKEPRWQDYEYEYFDEGNIFGYLGDGWTECEKHGGDTAYHLNSIDYPPVLGDREP